MAAGCLLCADMLLLATWQDGERRLLRREVAAWEVGTGPRRLVRTRDSDILHT